MNDEFIVNVYIFIILSIIFSSIFYYQGAFTSISKEQSIILHSQLQSPDAMLCFKTLGSDSDVTEFRFNQFESCMRNINKHKMLYLEIYNNTSNETK